MFIVLLLLFVVVHIEGARIGAYLNTFPTLHDNILMMDKTFLGDEQNSKGCGEFQIFCDWLYTGYKNENNDKNFHDEQLDILKNPNYMVFIKNPTLLADKTNKRRCSGFTSVCKNLDELKLKRKQNEYDQHSDESNQI